LKIEKSIILNLRWHRRIGLSLFLMVIFLALSGFALNHSVGLKLGNSKLSSDWLLSWYGLAPTANVGFELNSGNWLYQADDSKLFLDDQAIVQCMPPLLSAAELGQQIFALCDDALVMLTSQGQLIEKFTHLQGLPEDISSITVHSSMLYLHGISNVFAFDADRLTVTPTSIILPPSNTAPRPLPEALKEYLKAQGLSSSISLETLILDLHSGRFFGDAGVLFVDIVGVLLCILAITGLWAWVNHQRYRKDRG